MKNLMLKYFTLGIFLFTNVFANDQKIVIPQNAPTTKILYTIPGAEPMENQKVLEIKPNPELKINGIFDEQIKTHPLMIKDEKNSIIARIYFSYNNNGIYLFADALDKSPSLNIYSKEKINNGDSIELFFKFIDKIYHIGIKASKTKELWNWTLRSNIDRDNTIYKQTKNGYIIETQIPWHNFMMGCLCSLRNKELNFNVIINNKTQKNSLIKYKWCNIDFESSGTKSCGTVIFR